MQGEIPDHSGDQLPLSETRFDYSAVVTAAYIAANAINTHMLASPLVTLLNDFTQQPQERAGPQAGLYKSIFLLF